MANLPKRIYKCNSATIAFLASKYQVCPRTFKKWILPFKMDLDRLTNGTQSKLFTKKQIDLIYDKLGEPD